MRRSKLLKVMSIIIIIFGVLGILSSILMLLILDTMNQMMMDLGMPMFSSSQMLIGLIGAIVTIAAGILGIIYKSKSSVAIAGGLYLLFVIVENIFSTAVSGTFMMFTLIGLVFPALYLWGVYLSE
jgi:hypothetical protein